MLFPVFLRCHAICIPEHFTEIAYIIVAEYICDFLDCELGICKKIAGMRHAEPADIFTECHPRCRCQNPLHLTGTVVEKGSQMGKGERCIIFLHIFNDKNRRFVHNRGVHGRNDDVFFMLPQKLNKKDRDKRGKHCIFVAVIPLIFTKDLGRQIRKLRIFPCAEQQIRCITASIKGADKKA